MTRIKIVEGNVVMTDGESLYLNAWCIDGLELLRPLPQPVDGITHFIPRRIESLEGGVLQFTQAEIDTIIASQTAEQRARVENRRTIYAEVAVRCPEGFAMARRTWANRDDCISAEYETEDGTVLSASAQLERQGEGWYYVPLAAVQSAIEKAKAEQTAAEQRRQELLDIEVPPTAVKAYRKYRGCQDRAWEDENDHACFLIDEYADAIEAQGLVR